MTLSEVAKLKKQQAQHDSETSGLIREKELVAKVCLYNFPMQLILFFVTNFIITISLIVE